MDRPEHAKPPASQSPMSPLRSTSLGRVARKKGARSQPLPEGAAADDEVVELYDVGPDQPTGAWSAVDDTYDGTQWDQQTGYWYEPGVDAAPQDAGAAYGEGAYDPELASHAWHEGQYAGYEGQEGWEDPATGYYEAGEYDPEAYQAGEYDQDGYGTGAHSGGGAFTGDYQLEQAPQATRSTGRRANGPWPELVVVAALAVVAAAVVLAYMAGSRNQSSANSTGTTVASSTSSRPTTTARPTTTGGGTTTLPPPSPAAVRLSVTPGVEQSLVKSWVATNPGSVGIGPKDVAGTVPGQVYYARQPALDTYWALAAFQPSAQLTAERATAAGQAKLQQFQNVIWVFTWRAGPTWTELGEVTTGQCPDIWVPTPVLASWGLCGTASPHG
jgi:hypothetical protein